MNIGIKNFEDCIEKIQYGNKVQKSEYLEVGMFPIVSQESDLINGYWDDDSDVFKVEKPVIIFGDHTRTLKYIDFSFVLGADGTKILKPKDFIDSKFFYYFLQANPIEGKGYSRHYRYLKELKLNVPPLSIQQKIVAKLDAIFAEIDKATAAAETNAKNAEALFQSYLTEVFERRDRGWKMMELGKLAKFIDYRGKTPKKTDSGVRLITAKNVKFGYLNQEPYEYIAEEDYLGWMTRGIPSKGDVLFTTEAPLANVAQLDTNDKVVFAQRLIILQAKNDFITNNFLKYALMSSEVQKLILSKGTGATVKGIKASLLKLIDIKFPAIEEQNKLCVKLDIIKSDCEKLKYAYLNKTTQLEVYKRSILKQAFNGELVKDQQ